MVGFGRCDEGMEGVVWVVERGCGVLEVEFDGMCKENKIDEQKCE
jgi:hypothetical protein